MKDVITLKGRFPARERDFLGVEVIGVGNDRIPLSLETLPEEGGLIEEADHQRGVYELGEVDSAHSDGKRGGGEGDVL